MKTQNGSALLATMFIISCITIMMMSVMHMLTFSHHITQERQKHEQYQLLAEGVLDYGIHLAQEHFYQLLGAGQSGIALPELCIVPSAHRQDAVAGFLRMEIDQYIIHLIATVKEREIERCAVHCFVQADNQDDHYERGARRSALQVTRWQYQTVDACKATA